MTRYGGLGGIMGGRPFDPEDAFEAAVMRAVDVSDDDIASEMWGALANQDWIHSEGDTASYSMRAAGDLVAAVRGVEGEDYCTWYCSSDWSVAPRIAEALAREGWRPMTQAEMDAWDAAFEAEMSNVVEAFSGLAPLIETEVIDFGVIRQRSSMVADEDLEVGDLVTRDPETGRMRKVSSDEEITSLVFPARIEKRTAKGDKLEIPV